MYKRGLGWTVSGDARMSKCGFYDDRSCGKNSWSSRFHLSRDGIIDTHHQLSFGGYFHCKTRSSLNKGEVSMEAEGMEAGLEERVKTGRGVGWTLASFQAVGKGRKHLWRVEMTEEKMAVLGLQVESRSAGDSGDPSLFGAAGGQHQFSVSRRENVRKKNIFSCLSLVRTVLCHWQSSTIWTHYVTLRFLSGCVESATKTAIRLWGRSYL